MTNISSQFCGTVVLGPGLCLMGHGTIEKINPLVNLLFIFSAVLRTMDAACAGDTRVQNFITFCLFPHPLSLQCQACPCRCQQQDICIRGVSNIATDYVRSGIFSLCVNVVQPLLEERDTPVHLPNGRAAAWTEPTDTGGNIAQTYHSEDKRLLLSKCVTQPPQVALPGVKGHT